MPEARKVKLEIYETNKKLINTPHFQKKKSTKKEATPSPTRDIHRLATRSEGINFRRGWGGRYGHGVLGCNRRSCGSETRKF